MVTMEEIQTFAQLVAEEFHPERIILFGSYAYGSPGPESDVDILVVLPFEGKNFRMSMKILAMVNPPFIIDLLARRPDDTLLRYRYGDPLIREAIDHGRVLYESGR
ncbi:MAG: nucleotidyltransferase domain-containing protein [Candidatus Latescibacter sp.]|nr:nucleotidyltransferase domain-containing protein [Candidatus Latescibacter sp.]